MSPWNYPFLLSVDPLVEAIAAGNTIIIKTSEYSPYTNEIVKEIIEDALSLNTLRLFLVVLLKIKH